jgi:hypothetical protein
MKRLSILLLVMLSISVWAQIPSAFTYQGVARNTTGSVVTNQSIGLRLSILDGNTTVYTETFTTEANAQGVFSVRIGTGVAVLGSFGTVDWTTSGIKALKTEIDVNGGTTYIDAGTTAFTTVPYALLAAKVSSMSINDLLDVSATNASTGQVLQWNGTEWSAASINNQLTTNSTLNGNGTSANPLGLAQQGATSGQVLQWNGTQWTPASVLNGGTGDNWGTQVVQRNVTIDGNGTSAAPLRIAQQGATTGEALLWNGSTWSPGLPALFFDNVFTGSGTSAASPIKLAQQGATSGQVLAWDGTAQRWLPKQPLQLPASFVTNSTSASLAINNSNANGVGFYSQIDGDGVNGAGFVGICNNGRGVSGTTVTGYGVYGYASGSGFAVYGISTDPTGKAGLFAGDVQITGNLTASKGMVKPSDYYFFEQNTPITLTTSSATALPNLSGLNILVNESTSASTPAKIMVTVNVPNVLTGSSVKEGYQLQVLIKRNGTTLKQININDYVEPGLPKSISYTVHHTVTEPNGYTVDIRVSKGNATAAKDVTLGSAEVQIQVINP